MVFNETANQNFILPGETSQRHFGTKIANVLWDLAKGCKRLKICSITRTKL